MKKRKVRINKRVIQRNLILICIIWFIVMLICGSVKELNFQKQVYRVEKGDSIWSITREHKPEGMSYDEYNRAIYKLNPQLTPMIYPGDDIIIPIWEDSK